MNVAKLYIEYEHMALNNGFYYACNDIHVEVGMRVLVNFNEREIVGFVDRVDDMNSEQVAALKYPLKPILSRIDEVALMNTELYDLAKWMSNRYVAPYISCLCTMLPSKLRVKSNAGNIKKEAWICFKKDSDNLTKRQQEALLFVKQNDVKRSVFNKKYSVLDKLIAQDVVYVEQREVVFEEDKVYEEQCFELNALQKSAIQQMSEEGHRVYVLHGVTGSGKSEVFLQMAQQQLQQDKQVLILVPEIALTPQMVKKVKARFQNNVAIYHSSLNNQEKYEQYKMIKEGSVNIVVGTRSAVFMPFQKLGLIIMDEEHESSYKQDKTPKYHTRDIVLQRGKHHCAKVILASATPSLESYARALKGVYTLVKMPERIYGKMPTTHLINMQKAMRNGENYILSNQLKQQIQDRLQRKEQVILLLNRRGYAPVLRCIDCGESVMCPHCDLTLNYHKSSNQLVCHTCGYATPSVYACPKCKGKQLKFIGMGTQKLEEYVQSCFPQSQIVRMDADTTRTKNAHEKLLETFQHKGDILLGTQMIAKGLDFERVTLVGIVNADASLQRSDYRSVEMTFDMLVQASGRSGRGKREGEVYMQVYDPNHYALQCAQTHDYEGFFYQEMKYRHLTMYPPYSFMSVVLLSHKQRDVVQLEAQRLCIEDASLQILGPAPLYKVKDIYRYRFILKGKEEDKIENVLKKMYEIHLQNKHKSKIEIDVNPYMLD